MRRLMIRKMNRAQCVLAFTMASVANPCLAATNRWTRISTGGNMDALIGRGLVRENGKPDPVFWQEARGRRRDLPAGRESPHNKIQGHECDIQTNQFLEAACQARQAGSIGWVFQTQAGFGKTASFFDGLDQIESQAVDQLADHVAQCGEGSGT